MERYTEELLSKFACLDVVEKVRRAADENDAEGFAGAFTADATWSRPGVDTLAGRQAIRDFMARRPGGRVMRHVGGGADASLTSDTTAVVISQATIFSTKHDGGLPAPLPAPTKILEYRDELVRTPDGWQIACRTTTDVFAG